MARLQLEQGGYVITKAAVLQNVIFDILEAAWMPAKALEYECQ